MSVRRLDNVAIVAADLEGVAGFFIALGLEEVGRTTVEGDWAARVVGLESVRSEIVMLATPDGGTRLELMRFEHPEARDGDAAAPVNTLGLRRLAFVVEDIDASVATALEHGASLVGAIERYEDAYRLCYLRGPEGLLVMLAQDLRDQR